MKKFTLLLTSFIFSLPAYALLDPMTRDEDLSNTIVSVDVSLLEDGNYLYNYTLESPLSNKGKILMFSVDSTCYAHVPGPSGYEYLENYSDDNQYLRLGGEHPDFTYVWPATITAYNHASWGINRLPGTSMNNLLLISPEPPVDREYQLIPSMPTYGWDYEEGDEFDDTIPWTDDFTVIETTEGPGCPAMYCDGDGCYPDQDKDGDDDNVDNCPTVFNPEQSPYNDIGDACKDITPPPANTMPDATDDDLVAVKNVSKTFAASEVLSNDTDPESDALTITRVISGVGGSVTLNPDQTIDFTPEADFHGDAMFGYVISDGSLADNAIATIDVLKDGPANTAPVANDDSLTATENEVKTFVASDVLSNDTDPENNTLTIESVTDGVGGSVFLNPDQTITFTPIADFFGDATFTYEISDGEFTATATATIDVVEVVEGQIIHGTKHSNTLTGTEGDDEIYAYNGHDTINAGGGDDYVDGGNHIDTIYGEAGNDTLDGGKYGDFIDGGEGDDIITGGWDSGDDTITGGPGNDTIDGGSGHDTYIFNAGDGIDTIIDMDQYTNTLIFNSISTDSVWFTRVNDDVIINILGTTDQITILNWYTFAPLSNNYKIQFIRAGLAYVTPAMVEQQVLDMAAYPIPADVASKPPELVTVWTIDI